jgi:hypothetical protein
VQVNGDSRLEIFRLETRLLVNLLAPHHEAPLAAIVERARFIDCRHMRLDEAWQSFPVDKK